ncbi:MAG TPA: formimidoylglutamase [Daejeonella sp.]|nr:formimidoylglutamase [Daejeonella sp.]
MDKLRLLTPGQLLALTSLRTGETKLGEKLQTISSLADLPLSSCKFVLLGLPEDIGVHANFGIGGANTAWLPALKSLVNIQSTHKFRGDEMLVLGHLDFEAEMQMADQLNPANAEELRQLRNLVEQVDTQVTEIIKLIVSAGKIPVIVGGGHNNSYPILKAFSQVFSKPINTINIDAHADFRALEGRHSGNGFSYALKEKYLGKYAIVGLQENYNSQSLIHELDSYPQQISYSFLEDFIRGDKRYDQEFQNAMAFTEGICGLEIDLDSMVGVLSSAMSLSGFQVEQVRQMIASTKVRQIFYLHLAEGAVKLADGRQDPLTAKLIATLVSDFVKAQL